MSILRLDKDSFVFQNGADDDKDTYAEFFENEAKSSTRSRIHNFYRPEKTSGHLTEFINPKSRTARSDQKYEALYRRLLDVCLLFFQEVRAMSVQISNLQNKTTESVYHVCLKDILNWKKDTVDFWKVRCTSRHKDFEYSFRLAFKKFMTDFYDDEDVFDVNINTGIVIPGSLSEIDREKNKSRTPTIFYNIPDVGEFFYNVICFMTQLPDVKSTKILNNQTSLESCVYHSMNESMLQLSKDVIRTMESRHVISNDIYNNGGSSSSSNSDSVSVSSSSSKKKRQRQAPVHPVHPVQTTIAPVHPVHPQMREITSPFLFNTSNTSNIPVQYQDQMPYYNTYSPVVMTTPQLQTQQVYQLQQNEQGIQGSGSKSVRSEKTSSVLRLKI